MSQSQNKHIEENTKSINRLSDMFKGFSSQFNNMFAMLSTAGEINKAYELKNNEANGANDQSKKAKSPRDAALEKARRYSSANDVIINKEVSAGPIVIQPLDDDGINSVVDAVQGNDVTLNNINDNISETNENLKEVEEALKENAEINKNHEEARRKNEEANRQAIENISKSVIENNTKSELVDEDNPSGVKMSAIDKLTGFGQDFVKMLGDRFSIMADPKEKGMGAIIPGLLKSFGAILGFGALTVAGNGAWGLPQVGGKFGGTIGLIGKVGYELMARLPRMLVNSAMDAVSKVSGAITKALAVRLRAIGKQSGFLYRMLTGKAFKGPAATGLGSFLKNAVGKIPTAINVITKGLFKFLRGAPIIGMVMDFGSGWGRFSRGDYLGGTLSMLASAAGLLDFVVPGLGRGVSLGINAIQAFTDYKGWTGSENEKRNREDKTKEMTSNIDKAMGDLKKSRQAASDKITEVSDLSGEVEKATERVNKDNAKINAANLAKSEQIKLKNENIYNDVNFDEQPRDVMTVRTDYPNTLSNESKKQSDKALLASVNKLIKVTEKSNEHLDAVAGNTKKSPPSTYAMIANTAPAG